jgi:hypothetical protein
MGTSQALAERNVADQQGEPAHTERKHDYVHHGVIPLTGGMPERLYDRRKPDKESRGITRNKH